MPASPICIGARHRGVPHCDEAHHKQRHQRHAGETADSGHHLDASVEGTIPQSVKHVLPCSVPPDFGETRKIEESMDQLVRIHREQTDHQQIHQMPRHASPHSSAATDRDGMWSSGVDLSGAHHLGESSREELAQTSTEGFDVAQSKDRRHSHRKRHRHSNWSEQLSLEVERLKRRNLKLESILEEAGIAQQKLEDELDGAQRHRIELERLAHEGVASGSVAVALGENDNLRKQLSAYAVEIDVLRKEKEHLTKEKKHLAKHLEETQQAIQRLEVEIEQHHSSKRTLSQALEEAGHNSLVHTADIAAISAKSSKKDKRLQELTDLVGLLRAAFAQLQDDYILQTKEFKHFIKKVREQQIEAKASLDEAKPLAELARVSEETKASVAAGSETAPSIQMAVVEMAEAEAGDRSGSQSWKEASEEAPQMSPQTPGAEVRAEPAAADPQFAEDSERDAKRQKCAKPPSSRDRRRDPRAATLRRLKEWNQVLREIVAARKGAVLEKVHKGNNKRDPRRVLLSDLDMVLQWSKLPLEDSAPVHHKMARKLKSGSDTSLDLFDVIRIEYGSMSRACVLHSDVEPWNCFSLYTTGRSYDFACPGDDVTRSFVLAMSRLCNWAAGAIRSRHAFECVKGWCKVNEYCFKQRKTLAQVLLEACRKAATSESREHRPRQALAHADRRGHQISPEVSRSRVTRVNKES